MEAVVDAFASAMEWGERSTRAINLTTQAAAALAAIARVLPPSSRRRSSRSRPCSTDEEWREAALPFLPRASQRFWLERFPRSPRRRSPRSPTWSTACAPPRGDALLGQSESTYRVREAMDEGLIVLACPGAGGTRDRLLANLLSSTSCTRRPARGELPPAERKPFYACLDEVQTYDGGSSGNLAALLEQSAKFGLRASS